jgi:hypothetical protein
MPLPYYTDVDTFIPPNFQDSNLSLCNGNTINISVWGSPATYGIPVKQQIQ